MNLGIFKKVVVYTQDGIIIIHCTDQITQDHPEHVIGNAPLVDIVNGLVHIKKCINCDRRDNGYKYYEYAIKKVISGTYEIIVN
jgi:hypothetical protein